MRILIDCTEEIPCNPCEKVCPQQAIIVGTPISKVPQLDQDRCSGCAACITRCPGLAIRGIKEQGDVSLVYLPYEYFPSPSVGDHITCLDSEGNIICFGIVKAVRQAKVFDHTTLLIIEVPTTFAENVRAIFLGNKLTESGNYDNDNTVENQPGSRILCRCEGISEEQILQAIKKGARSVRAVKVETNAGMGACQGYICEQAIEQYMRQVLGDLYVIDMPSKRFPVRNMSLDDDKEADHGG